MVTEGKRINPVARRVIYAVVGLAVLFIIGALLAYAFREPLMRWALNPGAPYEEFTPPTAPDYSQSAAWAALPFKDDFADFTPGNAPVDPETRPADVFFIHPTTFLSRAGWNGPIDDPRASAMVDEGVMKHQASAFNACCRVFAPRYRQATFYYTIAYDENSWKALELAFGDVRRAFRHYLENWNDGRPVILAGHSQGARHLLHLLEAEVAGTPLEDRLVAAYVVGFGIPESKLGASLGSIGVCDTPGETGCLTGWTTIAEGGSDARYRNQMVLAADGEYRANGETPRVCVNPLSWKTDGAMVETEEPLAIPFTEGLEPLPEARPVIRRAQCRDGALWINRPGPSQYNERVFEGQDYHVYDYALFYMAIRENAIRRVESFLRSQEAAKR
ncbi:MAG: DUF3089 domain-containing protein [Alphaproteobacteria bacterium]